MNDVDWLIALGHFDEAVDHVVSEVLLRKQVRVLIDDASAAIRGADGSVDRLC